MLSEIGISECMKFATWKLDLKYIERNNWDLQTEISQPNIAIRACVYDYTQQSVRRNCAST